MEEGKRPAKIPKFERTTQEQLQYYIAFCKAHPQLQAGKNNPQAPRAIQILWDQLVEQLNALRGQQLNGEKYNLSQWKKQLRCRARKAKVHAMATGGGPRKSGVTEFEEQALETFGAAAVDGLPGIGTLGLQISPPEDIVIPLSPEENPSIGMEVVDNCAPPSDPFTPPSPEAAITTPNRKVNLEQIYFAATESMKVRDEREERALAQQKQLTEVLGQMSQSLLAVNQTLEKLGQMSQNLLAINQTLEKLNGKLDKLYN